jgi:hypothetical protein
MLPSMQEKSDDEVFSEIDVHLRRRLGNGRFERTALRRCDARPPQSKSKQQRWLDYEQLSHEDSDQRLVAS